MWRYRSLGRATKGNLVRLLKNPAQPGIAGLGKRICWPDLTLMEHSHGNKLIEAAKAAPRLVSE
jgi:hypothetical protein